MNFGSFLSTIDGTLFAEYRMEKFKDKMSGIKRTEKEEFKSPDMTGIMSRIQNIHANELPDVAIPYEDSPDWVKEYLTKRMINIDILHKYFYYTEDFRGLANIISPDTYKGKSATVKERRIVFTLIGANNKLMGIQGREVEGKGAPKYITIKTHPDAPKIFGLDRIDKNKSVYVLESPIDSMFLDNAIGVCGSDLVSQAKYVYAKKIYCFDQEPRSKIIVNKIHNAIKNGDSVVIFPVTCTEKDINEMVISGKNVEKLLSDRTFCGLRAEIEFIKWKKC
ncbi:MAG: hypothetical protein R8M45_04340 [Ghiorsea sp.]